MRKISRKTALKRIEAIMNSRHGQEDCFICIVPVSMLRCKEMLDRFMFVMKC